MARCLYKIRRTLAMVVLASSVPLTFAHAQPLQDAAPPHGGILVAAAGGTFHLEAIWPQQRIVRLFVYDGAMRQLPPDRVASLRGRVRVNDGAFELRPAGAALEARIPSLPVPARMTLELATPPGGAEETFALVFNRYSVNDPALDFVLPPTPIPDTLAGLLSSLRDDRRDARAAVDGGGLTVAYAPAIRARDHLLALDAYVLTLAPSARPRAEAAALAALRAAWMLHVAADNATSPFEVRATTDVLTEALDAVVEAFAGGAR